MLRDMKSYSSSEKNSFLRATTSKIINRLHCTSMHAFVSVGSLTKHWEGYAKLNILFTCLLSHTKKRRKKTSPTKNKNPSKRNKEKKKKKEKIWCTKKHKLKLKERNMGTTQTHAGTYCTCWKILEYTKSWTKNRSTWSLPD